MKDITYNLVKSEAPTLFNRIVAFASTVDLTKDDARAKIEAFMMQIANDALFYHDG